MAADLSTIMIGMEVVDSLGGNVGTVKEIRNRNVILSRALAVQTAIP